jgi:tellurite resistance protein
MGGGRKMSDPELKSLGSQKAVGKLNKKSFGCAKCAKCSVVSTVNGTFHEKLQKLAGRSCETKSLSRNSP